MRAQWWTMGLWLLLLTGGCATDALWNKAQLDAWNEPADNSRLQLFDASQQNDFLVIYEEYSERHDSTRTRAYFLNRNEKRVEQGRKPHFVSARWSHKLSPVPVSQTPPESGANFPQPIYAVISTNTQSFTVYAGEQKTNHDLPVYNDGWGRVDRIALTPVAVVADLTIIGGFLGYIWLQGGGPGYSR
ncbi:MAG TPA: hypothetical protein VJT54_02420 [Verrucomicrobiae bacterium]|nr:hypothetical protein [Verrucomicrobiae bacterium]